MLPSADKQLMRLAGQLEAFEASRSRPRTGTGSRREGERFESLVRRFWRRLGHILAKLPSTSSCVVSVGRRRYRHLSRRSRSLFLPTTDEPTHALHLPPEWFDVSFDVDQLIGRYPGFQTAVQRYAPRSGPYAATKYPRMFSGMQTTFDDTILLVECDTLRNKLLLEYKTAKSSKGTQIDGNAHERLSFQIMQFLEIATHFPRATLLLVANGAYVRYRNKYHVNFHVQADRLSAFAWFNMKQLYEKDDYLGFSNCLTAWLTQSAVQTGTDRR